MTRFLSALLLILAGLLAGSPARADVAYTGAGRYDAFQDQLLSFCYDDFLVVLDETPENARAASAVGAPLGDDTADGTIARPSFLVPAPVAWRQSSSAQRYVPPEASHPPCAEPSTGPPAL